MLFFAGWYAYEAGVFGMPVAQIKVKTVAYDPRDLLSGQYIRLNYSFSHPARSGVMQDKREKGGDIWVVLHEQGGFFEPKMVSITKPVTLAAGEVAIKGRQEGGRITYGIERYFVPEGTKEPNRDDVTVLLDVYSNGNVRINQVLVKGVVWP